MSLPTLLPFAVPLDAEIENNVRAALSEDVGAGDLTAQLVPEGQQGQATVIAREAAVICGIEWFTRCFRQVDPTLHLEWQVAEGASVEPGQLLCKIAGNARGILTAERSGLNFLQLLSGVATRTRDYAQLVAGTRAKVVDTRKTLPGLRLAQKYAVLVGGGANHRLALWDAILIKENHIMAAGSIAQAMQAARAVEAGAGGRCTFIEIEVESIDELQQALAAGADMVLLDNFSLDMLREAVAVNAGRAILEASGGVNRSTLRGIAETGVDRISIGELTKDVKALDLSLRFQV